MDESIGTQMYQWAKHLFPLNRSLTGSGVRETLEYFKKIIPELRIHEIKSGTKVFDWNVPKEWRIAQGWIADLEGNRLIDFANNNLHIVGYSVPVDKIMTKDELEPFLHSLPEQPDAIPYVTSYYEENFGFCLTQKQRENLGQGPYHIKIESELFEGSLTYADLIIPGSSNQEILFTTYICHPSMANNELSGPVVGVALAKFIESLKNRKYTYRFVFTVETIGTISYISKNLKKLKSKLVCGWVLTCIGDERTYSYVPTRDGDTLTDKISRRVLKDLGAEYREYSWLDRGSDERQYNSPGLNLPVASLMRSKYGEYPEYHTSLDNLDFISPQGLEGGLNMMKMVVEILESNKIWKNNYLCEPQLGKRNLYPNISIKETGNVVRNQMNVISHLDGQHDLIAVADKCGIKYGEVLEIIQKLKNSKLIKSSEI